MKCLQSRMQRQQNAGFAQQSTASAQQLCRISYSSYKSHRTHFGKGELECLYLYNTYRKIYPPSHTLLGKARKTAAENQHGSGELYRKATKR